MRELALPIAVLLLFQPFGSSPVTADEDDNKDVVYRVGNGVSAPELLHSSEPKYSKQARKAKYQGTVVLAVVISPKGRPRDVRVARSLGLGLDEDAVEAVKKWRFRPAMKDGKPVAVAVNVEVRFRLEGGEKAHVSAEAASGFRPPPTDPADLAAVAELIREYETFLAAPDLGTRSETEVAKTYADLASLLAYVERYSEAAFRYEEAVLRFPENPSVWDSAATYYATARAVSARNPKKAVEYALKAVKSTNEQNAAYLSTLAKALYADRQYGEAIASIRKAIALAPEKNSDYQNLLATFEETKKRP